MWAEIVGRADENAKLASTYLVFMASAGIIAGIGVLTGSAVLLVGAMAIALSLLPDLGDRDRRGGTSVATRSRRSASC